MQILSKIFQCADEEIAVPYIRNLAPHVIMIIHESKDQQLRTDLQLKICIEAITIFIQLLDQTDDASSKYIFVMYLV